MFKLALFAKASKRGGLDDVDAIMLFIGIGAGLLALILGIACPIIFIVGAVKTMTAFDEVAQAMIGEGMLGVIVSYIGGLFLLQMGIEAKFYPLWWSDPSEEEIAHHRKCDRITTAIMAVVAIVGIAIAMVGALSTSLVLKGTCFIIVGAMSMVILALGVIAKVVWDS